METKKEIVIMIDPPTGYEFDNEKSNCDRLVFKKKEVKFEHFQFMGAYVENNAGVISLGQCNSRVVIGKDESKNIWISTAHAKASLAMSQLSVLMASPAYTGDWVADWEDGYHLKFQIYFVDNEIKVTDSYYRSCFLSFKTRNARDGFLENHRELILEAKLLL